MALTIPPLDGVSPAGDFTPLEPGWYNVRVENAEETVASTGTPGVKLEFSVIDGEFAGRKVFDRMWISPAALGFVVQKLQAMQYPIPAGEFDLEPIELIGRRCAVKVETRIYTKADGTQGADNDVKAYDQIAGSDLPITPAEPAPVADESFPFD